MRAMGGRAAVKTGAEGVFAAIIPEKRLGIAVKIEDGASRAAEATIASLLVAPACSTRNTPRHRADARPDPEPQGLVTGHMELAADIAGWTP
jgi:L-asparaginase II